MRKTTLWTIRLSIALGLIGWIGVAIEDILLSGWDVFVNDLTHWEHYVPVFLLVAVGIIGGYTRGRRWEERLKLISTLQEKESLLTTVMETTPEYIWMLDTNFRIQYMNRTGPMYTREDLIGKPIYTLLPIEMQQREKRHLEQALKADSPYTYETYSFSSDGSPSIFENIAVPLKSGNSVVGLVISSRNITKERKSDEILKDSELKYQILVENSLQGIAIIQNEKYQYVNPAFARTVGYSVEEMLNFSSGDVWDLIHPDDKKELEKRNEDFRDGVLITPVQRFRYIRNEGSIKWVESQLTVIQYKGQPALQIFEVDITERMQAELQLQESERNIRTIIDSLQVGVALIDRKSHKIAYVNPIAEQMIGGSKEEIINSICHKFICQKEEGNCPIIDQGLKISNNETFLLNVEDESTPIMKSVIPITLGEQEYLLESFMDISLLKESQAILEENEELWQKILGNLPVILYRIDEEGIFTQSVGAGLKRLGLKDNQVIGLNAFDFYHDLKDELNAALSGEKVNFISKGEHQGQKWAFINFVFFDFVRGGGAIGYAIDISDRIHAEDDLRVSEEKYRSLFDRIPVGLYRTTPEGEILAINLALLTMLNLSSLDDSGKTSTFSTAEYPREQFVELMEKHGEIQGFEYQLKKMDGSSIDIRENSKAFRDKDGVTLYYEGSMEDITERKQIETSLARRSFDLEERMKELNILYQFSKLRNESGATIEEVLEGLINNLPNAYQFPDITCGRIIIGNNEFCTQEFQETQWRQVAEVKHHEKQIGRIEIFYTEERPDLDEGPFQKEERDLLDTIAREIGDFLSSKQDETELEVRNKIANIFLSFPGDEIYCEVLDIVLKYTKSKYGIFGFIDSDGSWVCPSMTRDIWDECQVPDKNIVLPHRSWIGLWGTAMKEKRSILSNDKFTVPHGHIPLNCALDVPILYQSKLIANILVGNKEIDYDDQDLRLLETVSKFISPILNARMQKSKEEQERIIAEQKLQLAHDTLAERVIIATKEITRDKQQIEAIIETSPNAIIVLNEKGVIIVSNNAFKELYERKFNQKLPFNLKLLQQDGGELINEIKEIFLSANLEPRIIEPISGYHLQLLSSRIGETDNDHSGQIIEFFDVTPFVEFEKAQKKFITTISHELRTPITAISLSVQNLRKYRSKMTEEQYEYLLSAVEENTVLLGEIVEGTTVISKIQSGDYDLNIQPYSLSSVLEFSINQSRSEAKMKNLEIIFEIESEIEMFGDSLKVDKIFKILLSNAIKFSPQDGVVKISVENNYLGKYNSHGVKGALIKISDKGPGIREEDIQKIFEPFQKTEDARDIQGLGLSLHLAQQIAEIHEGKIFVESEFGKGSTFFLFLPCMSKNTDVTNQ